MATNYDVTVKEVVDYCASMGRKISDDEALVALNKALEYMDGFRWIGDKVRKDQPHEWPRFGKAMKGMPAQVRRSILRIALVALDVEVNGEFVKGRILTGYSQHAPSGASQSFSYNGNNKGERIRFDWFARDLGEFLAGRAANFPVYRG